MPREPRFNLPGVANGVIADVLRLEVENDPVGLVNLVPNPNGVQGGYGWLSPGNGFVRGLLAPQRVAFYNDTPAIVTPIGGPIYATELMPVTPGQYIAARWIEHLFTATSGGTTAANARYHVWFEFQRADGTTTTSAASAYYQPTGATRSYAAVAVPANATGVTLVFHLHDGAGEFPAIGGIWGFREVTVAAAPTSAALTGLGYLPPPDSWTDILGPTHTLKINRAALNLGTLSAEVLDATLDPAVSSFIRPGKRIRVRARDAGGTYRTLFTGELTAANVVYHYLEDIPDQKRARITLTAVDALARLAAAPRTDTVATLADLAYVLEGCRVPWNINGLDWQVKTPPAAARAEGSSAVDQIEITRATSHAYAWVDKDGTLQVQDAAHMPTGIAATLDESVYTATAEVTFNTDECINELAITRRYIDAAGETQEETTGHYNTPSIARWGRHRAAFTVAGTVNPNTYAAAVFAANGTPTRRLGGVRVNVRDETFIPYAHLDLYARVTLDNDPAAINQTAVITALEHNITPDAWLIDYGFATPAAVAAPQVVPDLPRAEVDGWTTATLVGGWTHFDARTVQFRKVNGIVFMRGIAKGGPIGPGVALTLPPGYRPASRTNYDAYFPVISNGALGVVSVNGDGTLRIENGSNAWVTFDNVRFIAEQ